MPLIVSISIRYYESKNFNNFGLVNIINN